MSANLLHLQTINPESGNLTVIVESPKGTRNKFKFDPTTQLFRLHFILPEGAVFPFEFGFLPRTRAEDGDALDVVVMTDAPTFAGCVISARLIGIIEAEQTERGKTVRNDRLFAVSEQAHRHAEVKSLTELDRNVIDEMEHFFVSYNQTRGRIFKPIDRHGPKRAMSLVKKAMRAFEQNAD
jgi:inorganic pyrophosphatase